MFSGNYFSSSSDNYCKKRFITSVLKKMMRFSCVSHNSQIFVCLGEDKKSRNVAMQQQRDLWAPMTIFSMINTPELF